MKEVLSILDHFQAKFGIKFQKPDPLDVMSTSIKELDSCLGIGGFPEGKIIEISGESGIGKTALSYKFISEAQTTCKTILYISAEKSFSPTFADKMGVNLDNLVVCDAPSGESVFDIVRFYLDRNLIDIIVLDSLASLVSTCELEIGQGDYLQQANMIGILLHDLLPYIDEKKVTMLCLNQIRMDANNRKLKTPFDNIMSYYASIRIMLSKVKTLKKDRKVFGSTLEARIYKNNYGKLNQVNFDLLT